MSSPEYQESHPPNPSQADALSQRGLDLLAAGEAYESARAFRAAITADPTHVEAHHGLVRALRDAGQLEAAVAAAARRLEQQQTILDGLMRNPALRHGNLADAIAQVLAAATQLPKFERASISRPQW